MRTQRTRPAPPALPLLVALVVFLAAAPPAVAATHVSGAQSGTWTAASSPYVLTGGISVQAATSLTIEPGVVVRARAGVQWVVYGTLTTLGSAPQPVLITSDADTAGGAPAPGQWGGIFAESGSVVTLNETSVRFGGAGGWADLATSNGTAASVTWNGGGAYFSANDGIRIVAQTIAFTNMSANGNAGDGIEVSGPLPPLFNQLHVLSNGGYGIRVMGSPGSFDGTIIGSTNAVNGLYVEGTLGGAAADGTWSWAENPGFPYVVGALSIGGADTLHVASRVVVKFASTGSFINLVSGGAQLRTGTTIGGAETWFTSLKDDLRGGDTNGDGSATAPAPGDWTAIFADNGSSLDLYRTVFDYGGAGGWADVATSNSTTSSIAWEGGGAWHSANDGARVTVGLATFRDLSFIGNLQDGLEVSPAVPAVFEGSITCNGNGGYGARVTRNPGAFAAQFGGTGNGVNGLYVTGALGGPVRDTAWTWAPNASFPYVVGIVSTVPGDTLRLAAGAVVKYSGPGSYFVLNGGVMQAPGTPAQPVWCTSLKDDSVGGDTNGDGNATQPAPGDHVGIYADAGSRVEFSHTWLAYGGGAGWANLATSNGTCASIDWDGGGRDSFGTGRRARDRGGHLAGAPPRGGERAERPRAEPHGAAPARRHHRERQRRHTGSASTRTRVLCPATSPAPATASAAST